MEETPVETRTEAVEVAPTPPEAAVVPAMQVGRPSQESEFEITPYPLKLTGRIRSTVYEVGGTEPTGVIRTDQDWYVRVEWNLWGHLVHHLCGEFCICLYIECIGPGPEELVVCEYVKMDPCKPHHKWYSVDLRVPAGKIPGMDCGQVCCLAVTLTSILPCEPRRPGHIAAYTKGPCIMFARPAHD